MLRAKDIMTRDVITVSPKMEIAHVAKLLLEKGINGVPVVDEGKLVGVVCQSDLIAQQKKFPIPSLFTILDGFIPLKSIKSLEKTVQKIAATTVAQAMTSNPTTVHPITGIDEIASLMVDKNFHTVPVVEEGSLVGIIGKEDILSVLMQGSEIK